MLRLRRIPTNLDPDPSEVLTPAELARLEKVKPCKHCGVVKPIDEFYPVRRAEPDRLMGHCKACNAVRVKAWAQAHPAREVTPTNISALLRSLDLGTTVHEMFPDIPRVRP